MASPQFSQAMRIHPLCLHGPRLKYYKTISATLSMPFAHVENCIHEQQEEIWNKYLTNSGSLTLQRFMAGLLEIHVDAVRLAARQAHHKEANEQFRGETFIAGIELLEKISALEDEMEYIQFVWMLRSFVPIQAIVTVLMCHTFQINAGVRDSCLAPDRQGIRSLR